MKRLSSATILMLLGATFSWAADKPNAEGGFVSLFDGKTFDGWKVGKNPDTFTIEDGMLVANGPVAHLFYVGDVGNHDFKDFHFKADVMTFPKSNSGIYFHLKYQDEGFPKTGVECQVNNSHADWRRTGSLWGIHDIREVPTRDNVWFTQEIIVRGKHVVVKLDGKTVVDYSFPEAVGDGYKLASGMTWLSHGTFALQGHDPGSKACFKNIRVKILD
jgi:hypothetical protein